MAKRGAETYITKDSGSDDDKGSWGATSTTEKASAALLAKRKFAKPRGALHGRRPPAYPPANQQANGSSSTSGGFSFGQQQNGNQASASFPPFGGTNSNYTPPSSSSFNFGGVQQASENPFTSNTTPGSTISGFSGQIFNFQAPTTPAVPLTEAEKRKKKQEAQEMPKFAPMPSEIASNPFAFETPQPQQPSQPNTNGANLFSGASGMQQSSNAQASSNPFGTFGGFGTPQGQPNNGSTPAPSGSLFDRISAPDTSSASLSNTQPSSQPFSFGSANQPTQQPTPTPPSQPFSFGSSSAVHPAQVTPNMFPNLGKPSSGGFNLFGQPSTTQSEESSTGVPLSSTAPAQASTPGFAFGQVSSPTKQTQGNYDTMELSSPPTSQKDRQAQTDQIFSTLGDANPLKTQESPSKDPKHPLGRSLFDRVSKPTADASVLTNGHSDSSSNLSQGAQKNAATDLGSIFARASAPAASPSRDTDGSNLTQSSTSENTPRASSPSKAARPIAQPKRHIEDKPARENPFASILLPPSKPNTFSSTSSSSPFPAKTQEGTTTTNSNTLFGSLGNKNGQGGDNSFQTPSQNINSQNSGSLFKPLNSMTATSSNSTSNMFTSQSHPTMNTTGPTGSSSSKKRKHTTDLENGRIYGKLIPEHFTAEEQRQMITGIRLKELDAGMAMHLHRGLDANGYNLAKSYYTEQKQDILDAKGGELEPIAVRVAKRARLAAIRADGSKSQDSRASGIEKPTFGTFSSTTPNKRKADDENHGPSTNGKRVRGDDAAGEQIPYPSLPSTELSSSTSSMFKNILDKDKPSEKSPSKPTNSATSPTKAPSTSNGPFSFLTSAAKTPLNGGSTTTGPSSATTPSNVFTFKTTKEDASTSASPSAPSIKPPIFGSVNPTNFMSQFGKKVAESDEEAKKKRKAEEYDSDDSDMDEAEWERQDAEKQQAKKQKLQEDLQGSSTSKTSFIPGKGFTIESTGSKDNAGQTAANASAEESHLTELDKQHAAYGKQQDLYRAASAKAQNLFQNFDKAGSGNEGSKNGDADDEDDGSDGDTSEQPKAVEGKGLFDRVEHPMKASNMGINTFGQVSGPAASVKSSPAKKDLFGKLPSSTPTQTVFGTPNSAKSPITPGSGEKGDNTWKPESPIKFGGDVTSASDGAPSVSITSASPLKAPLGSLFGTSKINSAAVETPAKPALNFTAATPAGSLGSSFGFGISPIKPPTSSTSSLFPPSSNTSNGVSRSTSPGATTGESAAESTADGEDEGAEKHEQLNLTSGGPGEEDEDVLHEVRAKASIWSEVSKAWETKGLGPFRIMKNRDTGKTRMLMRQDPSGRVIINASIFKHFEYKAVNRSTFRVPIPSASGNLETWIVKVGKDADAAEITNFLEENKSQD